MAYETKALLVAIAVIVESKKSLCQNPNELNLVREIYNAVATIANTEGVVLKPFEETK